MSPERRRSRRWMLVITLAAMLAAACGQPVHRSAASENPWTFVQPAAFRPTGEADTFSAAIAGQGPTPWVVVGTVETQGRPAPTAWTSTDGAHWTRTALPLPSGGESEGEATAAAQRGDRTIVMGPVWRGATSRLTVWIARSGRWTLVPAQSVPDLSDSRAVAMAADAGGLTAVGASLGEDGLRRPTIWRSADGSSWRAERRAARTRPVSTPGFGPPAIAAAP